MAAEIGTPTCPSGAKPTSFNEAAANGRGNLRRILEEDHPGWKLQ